MGGRSGIGDVGTSYKRRKPCGNEEEVQIDRISDLPDSVLAYILSFMPTEEAVKTLLLQRFGFLWTTTDNLDFNVCSFHECAEIDYQNGPPYYNKRFINFVHHVLTLHQSNPIHRFHLKFEFYLQSSIDEMNLNDPGEQKYIKKEARLANDINTWTRFAITREVKVLLLDFLACGYPLYEPETLYRIPDFVFNCDSIREMKLVYCKVLPRRQICMRSLRILFLEHVALNDAKVEGILSGCPFLENLSLIECYNLCKLNSVSPNLKYLKVAIARCENSRLEISGPNIVSFDISGSVELAVLKNMSSIVDATFGFIHHFYCAKDEYHWVKKILENLKHAEVLTICRRSILVWTIWELMKISCSPSSWKHLILDTDLTKWHLPGITALLRSSPCLERLDIHIQPGTVPFSYGDDLWLQSCDYDFEKNWSTNAESLHCLRNHLKIVRIYGYVTYPCVVQLVQFLLKNAMVLEKMVIASKGITDSEQKKYFASDKLLELSQKLLSFPRASTSAVVLFS